MYLRNLLYQYIKIFIIHIYTAVQYSTVWITIIYLMRPLLLETCFVPSPFLTQTTMHWILCCSEHCHFIWGQLNLSNKFPELWLPGHRINAFLIEQIFPDCPSGFGWLIFWLKFLYLCSQVRQTDNFVVLSWSCQVWVLELHLPQILNLKCSFVFFTFVEFVSDWLYFLLNIW